VILGDRRLAKAEDEYPEQGTHKLRPFIPRPLQTLHTLRRGYLLPDFYAGATGQSGRRCREAGSAVYQLAMGEGKGNCGLLATIERFLPEDDSVQPFATSNSMSTSSRYRVIHLCKLDKRPRLETHEARDRAAGASSCANRYFGWRPKKQGGGRWVAGAF
jgi:hypothetical protein